MTDIADVYEKDIPDVNYCPNIDCQRILDDKLFCKYCKVTFRRNG